MAQFGGINCNKVPNLPDGTFQLELIRQNIREENIHCPITKLICIENTHNFCGGRILPLEWIDKVTELSHQYGIPVHMDGARVFSAAVGSGIPLPRILRDVDTVNICLSKNLGAPMGSVLVGTADFIKKSRRLRKALGGGMRQVGMMASAGIYALDHMVNRLAEDHQNAIKIAKAILSVNNPNFTVDLSQVQTNMIVLLLKNCEADFVCERLAQTPPDEVAALGSAVSIHAWPKSDSTIRLVLHADAAGELADKAAEKLCHVAKEMLES